MRYRRMGRSGLKVSEISLGGWFATPKQFDDHALTRLMSEALERGVNLIDLADIYDRGGVEERYGHLLKGYPRHQVILSTKCYWPMSQGVNDCGLSRKHLHESVHASLQRLQTDYIDLFHCHRFDQDTPLEETIYAIGDLIRQGKILYWGVCGWNEIQLQETHVLCKELNIPTPISHQLLYNLIERGAERQLMTASADLGLGVMTWSTLAGGVLAQTHHTQGDTGNNEKNAWSDPVNNAVDQLKGNPGIDSSDCHSVLTRFTQVAQLSGVSPAQLSLLWSLRRPEVSSLIVGVSAAEQLKENLDIFELEISEDVWGTLDDLFPL